MSEGVKLFLQYGAGPTLAALITVIGLVVQNKINKDVEVKRIADNDKNRTHATDEAAKERKYAAQEAQLEREQQERLRKIEVAAEQEKARLEYERKLADQYRKERRLRYVAFLELLERLFAAFRAPEHAQFSVEPMDVVAMAGSNPLSSDLNQEASRELALLKLIGSDTTAQLAEKLVAALRRVSGRMYGADLEQIPDEYLYTAQLMLRDMKEARKIRTELLHAIRADLGTTV